MKSISSIVVASLLFSASYVLAEAVPAPVPTVALKAMTTEGCYGSSTGLTFNSSYMYQTSGYCQVICVNAGYAVLATTNSQDCWCGDEMPPLDSKADSDSCDDPCAGYDTEMCGDETSSYFNVYLSGTKAKVSNAADSASSTGSSSSSSSGTSTLSSSPSVVTLEGQTIIVTATGQAASVSAAAAAVKNRKSNTAGIAAGVVVGVVVIAAIAGGVFLMMRNRRKREIEEDYRRSAHINSMTGKSPGSSGGYSQDTRLEPSMAQRRMSDGSIADNQDYSRRILKVTNA